MPFEMPVHVERDTLVPMRDGVRLATDVFRPPGDGRYPVLLKRTPYGKKQTELIAAQTIADLIDHGYAVVVQDVRGRFNSEGQWTPFACEIQDGYDTVVWAAAQPWASGRVGMFGISYLGLTQLLAAAGQPEPLVAIAPANSPSDLHENWVYAGAGVLDLLLSVGWVAAASADTASRGGVEDSRLTRVERALGEFIGAVGRERGPNTAREASRRLFTALDPLFRDSSALDRLAPWLREWLEHPEPDAYWAALAPATYYERMSTPALHITGWYDAFVGGVIANYVGLRDRAATPEARRGQRLIVGPWQHAGFEPCPPGLVGEVDFGAAADIDFPDLQRRWFDYWLKDEDTGVLEEAPVRLFVMGENRWRDEREWPLARTSWTHLYLHSRGNANSLHGDGLLCVQAPVDAQAPDHFSYDPANPVPTIGGALLHGAALAGPFDQRENEERLDVLVYTSDPMTDDLEVTGPVSVELWLSSSSSVVDFIARLVDVYPDGRALNLCDGVIRARCVKPDAPCRFRIEAGQTSNLFKSGHQIRLEISSSSYPHYQPNPRLAEQTVYHDPPHPSYVLMPYIPR